MQPSLFRGLEAVYAPLTDLVARTGKIGASVVVVLGLGHVAGGIYLCFFLIEDAWWPAMLGVSGIGLVLTALGVSALFGAQARVSVAIAEADAEADPPSPDLGVEAVRTEAPPFWICAACPRVEAGRSVLGRCLRCGREGSFVQVDHESQRSTAKAVLGIS